MNEVKSNIHKHVSSQVDLNDFDNQISEVHYLLKKLEEVSNYLILC
jgi:hypothetical protein